MSAADRVTLLEKSLTRAANAGDLTKPVLARFFAAYPQAKSPFSEFGEDQATQLQAAMVEQALYCVMTWYESPAEVEIFLQSTIPHHLEMLAIPATLFEGLLTATLDVIADSVPTACSAEHELLRALRLDLADTIKTIE